MAQRSHVDDLMLVRDRRLPVKELGRITLEHDVHRSNVILHRHVDVGLGHEDAHAEMIDWIARAQPLRLLDFEASSEQDVVPVNVLLVAVKELIVRVENHE
ncbi:MAG: hypothetical protein ACK56F_11935, partial [bacterium]